jgi:hypothetical protein
MITCKDCLCYEACGYHITEETDMTVEECSTGFKHKDQYTQLPVYIGQPIWRVITYYGGTVELVEGKVSMIQQKADRSWKFRMSRKGSVGDYTLKDIGTRVFLDKLQANKIYEETIREVEALKSEVSDDWFD